LTKAFADERKRLSGMESLWDPGTQVLLDDLGIGSGWRCLEVGAGGGSMVEWMASRGAHVTAIDIDTRFIEHLASDSITVRRIDLRENELPRSEYDLVHSRLVLEHLADRKQVLDRLVATLKPGGWMVIEDYDWTCFGFEGESQGFSDIADVILGFMAKAGFQRDYGRRVVADLDAAGLTDIRGEGRARLIDSSSPGFDFFRLTFESLRGAIVDAGLLSVEEADAAAATFNQNVRLLTPMMMAGIGRRA
jgi:SAM-dependent methyltransferase